jgi:hypothetical protein
LPPFAAALFTAQGVYSPNNNSAQRREGMADYLQNTTAAISAALAGSGVPGAANTSASLNASLAALPFPLLDITPGAELQLQAMQAYAAITTWVGANATAT